MLKSILRWHLKKSERGIKAMNVSDVKKLNARIEELQTKRTKLETKREMLLTNLAVELQKYAQSYGVDLHKEKLSLTKKAVDAEKEKVEKEIQREYDLKQKVVSAIESGDIATAKKLLGVTEETDEDVIEADGGTAEEVDEDEYGDGSGIANEGDYDDDIVDEDTGYEDEEDEVNETEEAEEAEEVDEEVVDDVSEGDGDWGDLSVNGDEEEEVAMTTAKSFLDAVNKAEPKSSKKVINDFEDADLDDFGFGSITKGTKFGKK